MGFNISLILSRQWMYYFIFEKQLNIFWQCM